MQECHELVKQLSAKKAGGAEAQGNTSSNQPGPEEQQKESDDMDGAMDMLATGGDGLAVEDPDTVAAKAYALSEFDHMHPFSSATELKAALSRDVPCPTGHGGCLSGVQFVFTATSCHLNTYLLHSLSTLR